MPAPKRPPAAHRLLAALVLAALVPLQGAGANAFDGRGILSLDFGYMGEGLRNNGWGLGLSYEHKLTDFVSLKESFSHMSLKPDGDRDWVTSVGLGISARLYPFGRGLDKLYIGYGLGSDFLMFAGSDENETYISHCPHVGWKQSLRGYAMADLCLGYRIKMTDPSGFALERGLAKQGFEYSASVQLNLSKIWRSVRRR